MFTLATKLRPAMTGLEIATRAGFEGVELWTNCRLLAEPDGIRHLAGQFSLSYAIHSPNKGELSRKELDNLVELSGELNSRAIVIHQPMYDRYGPELIARNPELPLGVENHRLSPAEFEDWANQNRGLTLDVEHLWKFTLYDASLSVVLDCLRTFLSRYAHKLVHVHLPGYVPGYSEHRPMYCNRDLVFAVLSLLDEYDFRGLVVGEVNIEFQNELDLLMDVTLGRRWQQLNPRSRTELKVGAVSASESL